VTLGAQMKQMHNLRIVAANIIGKNLSYPSVSYSKVCVVRYYKKLDWHNVHENKNKIWNVRMGHKSIPLYLSNFWWGGGMVLRIVTFIHTNQGFVRDKQSSSNFQLFIVINS
jgi:hypothetical protein